MAAVDVITPVFNTRFEYLTDALRSLRGQTLPDWNAWIVDDGSDAAYAAQLTDTLRSYDDARLHYLRTDHKGPGEARNVAIAHGTAPYVAFLDSDDRWMPHHLSRQVAALNADPSIALTHGYCEVMDATGRPVPGTAPLTGLGGMSTTQSFVRMLQQNYVGTTTVVVRRSVLEMVGGFDTTFRSLGDKELWLRLLAGGARFRYEAEASAVYRVHAENISHNTDLLLATRRRLTQKAEDLVRGSVLLAGIDWPPLKQEMSRHMHQEAAEVHFEQGRYAKAMRFAVPWLSGWSWRSCKLLVGACLGLVRRSLAAAVHRVAAFAAALGGGGDR